MKKLVILVLLIGLRTAGAQFSETFSYTDHFFHSTDSLAPRDDLGLLHQSRLLYSPDFAPRYGWRPLYWLEGERDLIAQPAYVGALQRDLRRLGYYCGPINGVFSAELSDAIARMQKSYSQRVTGRLSVPVRRALFLP